MIYVGEPRLNLVSYRKKQLVCFKKPNEYVNLCLPDCDGPNGGKRIVEVADYLEQKCLCGISARHLQGEEHHLSHLLLYID